MGSAKCPLHEYTAPHTDPHRGCNALTFSLGVKEEDELPHCCEDIVGIEVPLQLLELRQVGDLVIHVIFEILLSQPALACHDRRQVRHCGNHPSARMLLPSVSALTQFVVAREGYAHAQGAHVADDESEQRAGADPPVLVAREGKEHRRSEVKCGLVGHAGFDLSRAKREAGRGKREAWCGGETERAGRRAAPA